MINMKKEVLFVLLNDYADWEGAYVATALNKGVVPGSEIIYTTKVLAPTTEDVHSLGGFRTVPDYSFDEVPENYAALILIGGESWKSPEAECVASIVRKAIEQGKVVGGICAAASFLAAHGFLNDVKHTGNGVDNLKQWSGDKYTNEFNYIEAQAVSDKNIVTANGTGCLEFTRELLLLLKADTEEKINEFYDFQKDGFIRYFSKMVL